MATVYLRPSSDVNCEHSKSSGSTGYNLINETTKDDDSTYIYVSAYNTTANKTSTFNCSGTITSGHKITSAKAIVYAKISNSSASNSKITVSVGSSSSQKSASATSYTKYEWTLQSSDIEVSGTTASAVISINSTITDSNKTNCEQRITQVYLELTTEAVPQYTITASKQGTGTITPESPVFRGDDSIVKIYPGTNLTITSLTDNGTNVTSSIVHIDGAPQSNVTGTASGATYGYAQSGNYWVSQNKNVNKSYAICQLNIVCKVAATLNLAFINYAEATYDYGIIGNVDQTLSLSYSPDPTNAWNGKDSSKNKSTEQTLSLQIPAGSHFVQFKYIKDDATSSNNDDFRWRIASLTYNTTVPYEQYTISNVQANHTLVVTFSDYSGSTTLWIKVSEAWIPVGDVYKKVNGSWQVVYDYTTLDSSKTWIKKN